MASINSEGVLSINPADLGIHGNDLQLDVSEPHPQLSHPNPEPFNPDQIQTNSQAESVAQILYSCTNCNVVFESLEAVDQHIARQECDVEKQRYNNSPI